jgi:hypothetical protein
VGLKIPFTKKGILMKLGREYPQYTNKMGILKELRIIFMEKRGKILLTGRVAYPQNGPCSMQQTNGKKKDWKFLIWIILLACGVVLPQQNPEIL